MAGTAFDDMRGTFERRVSSVVWASVSTQDTRGRLRARILHPVWEFPGGRPQGWIATGRQSLKARHLAGNPYVSVAYWTPDREHVIADCRTEWAEDPAEKQRVWALFGSKPEPYGYDLHMFWKSAEDPTYGALKLSPWRVEMWSIGALAAGEGAQVWQA
ncbi:MAG: pyridoxamine 5'-phosphate oxidase family protein [Alphaproteobacteria bacterium]|nr:pyridoxamine 5'-phosphate oxidase family protein [Alphaproteobacteria bacterium]